MKELSRYVNAARAFYSGEDRRFAVLEGNRDCNRNCSYCAVPKQYLREQEQTVEETLNTVDWLFDQGYRMLSYLGGEPLAPFQTKEGISFIEHTLRIVSHASTKGMVVNVTTNGDYVTEPIMDDLKAAGLDSLTLSLHSYTEPGLNHLLRSAHLASNRRILPTIQTAFTSANADELPGIAARVAQQGVLFGLGIVQEKGGEFSARQGKDSAVPSIEQQKLVLGALLRLKTFGFVRNNAGYLRNAPSYYKNNWTCDSARDTFIHIGAGGTLDVCSDIRTGIRVADIQLADSEWRNIKSARVSSCGNCLYHCYYEAQNIDWVSDVPMGVVAMLISSGNAHIAESWGKFAVAMVKRGRKDVDWQTTLGAR